MSIYKIDKRNFSDSAVWRFRVEISGYKDGWFTIQDSTTSISVVLLDLRKTFHRQLSRPTTAQTH